MWSAFFIFYFYFFALFDSIYNPKTKYPHKIVLIMPFAKKLTFLNPNTYKGYMALQGVFEYLFTVIPIPIMLILILFHVEPASMMKPLVFDVCWPIWLVFRTYYYLFFKKNVKTKFIRLGRSYEDLDELNGEENINDSEN